MTTETERIETEVRAALVSRESRAFLWWILSEAGIYRTTFVVGAADMSAHLEGKRSLGLQILERIERFAPGSTDLMKKEAREDAEVPTRQPDRPQRGRRGRRIGPDDPRYYAVADHNGADAE